MKQDGCDGVQEGQLVEDQGLELRLDGRGVVRWATPGLRALLGSEEDTLVGKSWFSLLPAQLAPLAREALAPWLEGSAGAFALFQCPLPGPDGALRGVAWCVLPSRSGAVLRGTPVPASATSTEWIAPAPAPAMLQAQAQHERLVRDSRFLDSVFENIPDVLFVKDVASRRYVRVNKAAEQLGGLSRGELLGRSVQELSPGPEVASAFLESDREVLDGGKLVDMPEEPIYTEHGMRWVHTRKIPLFDEAGRPEYLLGIIEDITERKQAEQALRKLTAELARSNQDLEQFAYAASHDLQEPLRMVRSFAGLLGRRYQGKLDQEADDYLGFIIDGAGRMQRLITGLLEWARVDTQGRPMTPTPCDALLETVLFDLQLATREANATVHVEPLPTVRGDAAQLGELFTNLIGNAIKFHGEAPPVVHVAARRDGEHWRFSVRDNGIGIPEKDRERLFRPFQRLNEAAAYKGTGLGLAICRRIVERHGGRIWVERAPEGGSEFLFTLRPG